MSTARQIMNTSYHALNPSASILEALRQFKQASTEQGRRVFGMMVIEDGQLVGVLSMYDILIFLQPKHVRIWGEMGDIDFSGLMDTLACKSEDVVVGDIMSTEVTTVQVDTHLFTILEIMNRKHIRRIPVVEENHVVGIVYISDLFFHLVDRI